MVQIAGILCTAIVFATIYGLFNLFVRRKERMAIIEKIGDKLDASYLRGKVQLPSFRGMNFSFGTLQVGCLLIGIGVGLLVGLMIHLALIIGQGYVESGNWLQRGLVEVGYGSSVLLFGGLGLIIAFLVEMNLKRKVKKEEKEMKSDE